MDFGSARGLAHLLGRRKSAPAATIKPLASTPAKAVPTARPQPKAERTYARSGPPREEHPQLTAAELRADLQAAAARDLALYGQPTEDELAKEFAIQMEAVAAKIEGREPRANLAHGPNQERREVTAGEILKAGRGAVI